MSTKSLCNQWFEYLKDRQIEMCVHIFFFRQSTAKIRLSVLGIMVSVGCLKFFERFLTFNLIEKVKIKIFYITSNVYTNVI